MNPFTKDPAFQVQSPQFFSSFKPSSFDGSINPNYALSVQQNNRFASQREINYTQMIIDANAIDLPHTIVYKTQYRMDLFLSCIRIEPCFYSILTEICAYISLSYSNNISNTKDSKTPYSRLLRLVSLIKKDKEWLDYAIAFVMTITSDGVEHDCPYLIARRLLNQIQFEQFYNHAQIVIDLICSRYSSLSLSPHTIAYFAVVATMQFYYGDCSKYQIFPEQSIPERERYLCLCILSHYYPEMHSICIRLTSEY